MYCEYINLTEDYQQYLNIFCVYWELPGLRFIYR